MQDEAALRPLFGAMCLEVELNDRVEGDNTESFLWGGNAYAILRNFTRLRCLQLGDWGPTVFLEPDYDQTNIRGLVASGGEPEAIVQTVHMPQTVSRLVDSRSFLFSKGRLLWFLGKSRPTSSRTWSISN